MEKGLIFLKLIHYKGQDMLSAALNDVHKRKVSSPLIMKMAKTR